jgi:hypothetical protein
VDVLTLATPDVGTVQRRLTGLLRDVGELAGLDLGGVTVENGTTRTVLRIPGGPRAVGFHASGAMSVDLGLDPFEGVFGGDPGDKPLIELLEANASRLGLGKHLPADDALTFERLWRIKAAGGDAGERLIDAVLCRAVGAYRHHVRDLPVYGRATATVHLAAEGKIAGVSLSTRRFVDDGHGQTLERAATRAPGDAAREVVDRLAALFRSTAEPTGFEVSPEWFRFGYLSLGRRRAQSILAPFYLASLSLRHEEESTAHVIAVAGSQDQYLKLPLGQTSSGQRRAR